MVGAKLLAKVDAKLRAIMTDVGDKQENLSGLSRAFGGIHVVSVGDFWQLDPPKGGFLGDKPLGVLAQSTPVQCNTRCRAWPIDFWDDGEGSAQGVTELTECVRTEDPWLLQVQNEMRDGNLSKDAWNFLHGRHTTVPGSFVDNRLTCNNPLAL